jgi:two-component system, LytTR family, response regulator
MIKTLIVDDERLARAELKRLLSTHPQIQILAEATNADEAKTYLAELDIDLVFLDIQMPGTSGLELAATLNPELQFVFCTAFDSYALDAFELNALDYLVKPLDPERLRKTLERFAEKPSNKTQTANYLPESHGLLLKFGDTSRIVRLNDISRFESVGNHSAVYTPYGKSFLHSSLSKIELRLDPQQFFKASRADIIRVSAIKELEPGLSAGSMLALMHNGEEVEVSRRQVQVLRQLFGGI